MDPRSLDGALAVDLLGPIVGDASTGSGDELEELAIASYRSFGELVALPDAGEQPLADGPLAGYANGILGVWDDDWSYSATTVDGAPVVITLELANRHLRFEYGDVQPSALDSALGGNLTKAVDGLKAAAVSKVMGAIGAAPRPIRAVLTEDFEVVDDLTFAVNGTIDNREMEDELRQFVDRAADELEALAVTEDDEDELGLPGGFDPANVPGGLAPAGRLVGGLSPAGGRGGFSPTTLPGGYSPAPGRSPASPDLAGGGLGAAAGGVGAVAGLVGGIAGRAVAGHVRQAVGGGREPADLDGGEQAAPPAASDVRFCTQCGTSLDTLARFCPRCGTPAATPPPSVGPPGVGPGVLTEAATPHPQLATPTMAIPPEPEIPVAETEVEFSLPADAVPETSLPESEAVETEEPSAETTKVPAALPGVDTTMIFATAGVEVDETAPVLVQPQAAPPVENVSAPPLPDPVATQPPPAPAVTQPPPVTQPAPKPAWRCTHTVPSGGVWVWQTPDPSVSPTESLPAGVQLQFVEAKGSWWKVAGWNGWEGWVDGRLLVPAG